MKLRVIFFSDLDVWSIDANKGAPSFYKTIELYVKLGHEVFLVKPTTSKRKDYPIDGLIYRSFNNELMEKLVSIPKISFFARFANMSKLTRSFIKHGEPLIKDSNVPCLLYAYEVHAVDAAAFLSKKYNIPFITRFQGSILVNIKDTFINRLKYYVHFKGLSKKSNLVIMTDDGSEGDRILKELGNATEEIHFWRNGVGEKATELSTNETHKMRIKTRQQLSFSETDTVLMTLSRLVDWKRVDRSVNALALLTAKYPSCKLMIVGDGNARKNLESLVKLKGLERKVNFVGAVEQREIYKYFAAADIFLSLYDLTNVGNPLWESMRHNMPIITINNGDTKSVVIDGYNGILLNSGDPQIVANAIERLINNSELKEQLSKSAGKFAKENLWSWEERMNEEYKYVYCMVKNFYIKHQLKNGYYENKTR